MSRVVERAISEVLAQSKSAVRTPDQIVDAIEAKLFEYYGKLRTDDIHQADRLHGGALGFMHQVRGNPYTGQHGATNGAFMRAVGWGRIFSGEENREILIKGAMRDGAITHMHPDGFLSEVGAALFTAFALEDIPIGQWNAEMQKLLLTEPLDDNKYFKYACEKMKVSDDKKELFAKQWKEFFKQVNTLQSAAGTPPKLTPEFMLKLKKGELITRYETGRPLCASGAEALAVSYIGVLQSLLEQFPDGIDGKSVYDVPLDQVRAKLEEKEGDFRQLCGKVLANSCFVATAPESSPNSLNLDRDSVGCGAMQFLAAGFCSKKNQLPTAMQEAILSAK